MGWLGCVGCVGAGRHSFITGRSGRLSGAFTGAEGVGFTLGMAGRYAGVRSSDGRGSGADGFVDPVGAAEGRHGFRFCSGGIGGSVAGLGAGR